MASPIRIAVADLNQTPLAWPENTANLLAAISAAKEAGCRLLITPELSVCGYGCEDQFFSLALEQRAWKVVEQKLVPASNGLAVLVGLPLTVDGSRHNTAALLVDKRIVAVVAKQRLAGSGVHYEPRWFSPWPQGYQRSVRLPSGESVPCGEVIYELDGVRIGFEICEDAWGTDRPAERLIARGAQVIANPSASHFSLGKLSKRHEVANLITKGGVLYAYSNLVGNEGGRTLYDGGSFFSWKGGVIAQTPRLHYQPFRLAFARSDGTHSEGAPADWERSHVIAFEEFARAVALGLYDYHRKSRSRGFALSLSGGADSAAVAILVSLMGKWSRAEWGAEKWAEQLFGRATPIPSLLATAYQRTANSSSLTRSAAQTIADLVEAEHFDWDVGPLVTHYESLVSTAIGEDLSWEKHDLARQNIQARVRAPAVWLLANLHSRLLLSTSNRSEGSVGYCTMDGDTAGGLCPIGGVSKTFIRDFLQHLQHHGLAGIPPIPQLRCVNEQKPTAELRPAVQKQTDEADLMPYSVLNAVEAAAIVEKLEPTRCWQKVCDSFPAYDRKQIGEWVIRFYELWSRSQWKRERLAPSFHLEEQSVDPKTWCRFPILSGGFREELSELRSLLRVGSSGPR